MKPADRLEKFVIDKRSEFDSEVPGSHVWHEISQRTRTHAFRTEWLWKAAAVIFFGMSTFLYFDRIPKEEGTAVVNEEFMNTEAYYTTLIQERKEEIASYLDQESPYYKDFKTDIAELDSMYNQLKIDLKNGNEEMVMEAMIRNLQLRIEIMDKQLQVLKNIREINEQSDEEVVI